jgi:hypothetical protein
MSAVDIGNVVAAIGALGTSAFALVDATKIGKNGGISNSGFIHIETAIKKVFPHASRNSTSKETKSEKELLHILHGNWINGTPLADQKAIAKSLIKLRLNKNNAESFATATEVDSSVLTTVAVKMTTGEAIATAEANVLGRFDLALTAILDEGYNRADQKYRNHARALASVVAIVLAILGGWAIDGNISYFWSADLAKAALCGLLATPLAPISKDLATALAAGVKVAQTLGK